MDNLSSKSQKRQRLIVFNLVSTIPIPMHPEEQHLPFKQTVTTTIFSFEYQYCTWPRSNPICWQNPFSGCNSGIHLVVVLEYTFFQRINFVPTPNKFLKLKRFRTNYHIKFQPQFKPLNQGLESTTKMELQRLVDYKVWQRWITMSVRCWITKCGKMDYKLR